MYARFAQLFVALVVFACLVSSPLSYAADDAHEGGAHPSVAASNHPDPAHEAGGDTASTSEEEVADDHDVHHMFSKPPLYLSPQLLIFTLVCFGLYFIVMKKIAWLPIIAGLNEREARILRAERDAAQAKAEAARFHEQADQRMIEAHNQVKEILARARAEAEAQKLQIVSDAEQHAKRVKEDALQQISAARQQAVEELNQMVDNQASMASSRIAGRSLN